MTVRRRTGKANNRTPFPWQVVPAAIRAHAKGSTWRQLGERYGVNPGSLSAICSHYTWSGRVRKSAKGPEEDE